jgi:hypothetical protein
VQNILRILTIAAIASLTAYVHFNRQHVEAQGQPAAALAVDDKPAVACCQPTETQRLRLTVWNRETQLAYRDLADANRQVREKVTGYQAFAEQIKKENHWPDSVTFNPQDMTFTDKPAPKPAETAPKKP